MLLYMYNDPNLYKRILHIWRSGNYIDIGPGPGNVIAW